MSELPTRKPDWLKVKAGMSEENLKIMKLLRSLELNTVCEEADCPNRGECFKKGTATFMILGSNCTRSCKFCAVNKCPPEPVDLAEPQHVAAAVKQLALRHVVITSVTRDDLPDGGASHFANVIYAVQKELAGSVPVIEVLIPDLQGDLSALQAIIQANPDIINHNVETVPRLYPEVRPQAIYKRSMELIQKVKQTSANIITKSGVMLGLGETREEVLEVLQNLHESGCDILTIGQYLAPSRQHYPVAEYIHPDVFAAYKKEAEKMGFLYVASGPLIRSSYMAGEAFDQIKKESLRGKS